MTYNPRSATADILDRAMEYVYSVPYAVTARWLFYRLLQDGTLEQKADYKRLLSYLSKARKEVFGDWRPWTLADDTRAARIRGVGFISPQAWLGSVRDLLYCNLDRWYDQPHYVECWFEAAAMMAQFDYYAPPIVPLLAFHGDISIPEKWKAAERLVNRWLVNPRPIVILYYGDLDPKGIQIPNTAEYDIRLFAAYALAMARPKGDYTKLYHQFGRDFEFIRVGLLDEHVDKYDIPENPERPGTFQWEGLSDEGAAELIGQADDHLFHEVDSKLEAREYEATSVFLDHLSNLSFEGL